MNPTSEPAAKTPSKRWRRSRHLAAVSIVFLTIYLLVSYLVVPHEWDKYENRHPLPDDHERITLTADDHPGDPLNVALVGTEDDLKRAMQAAKWFTANPLGLKGDLEIGVDTVLKRTFDDAPVSNLFLYGRKEDLAFEQPTPGNPRHRHHVRFWRSSHDASDGRPFWVGSASYDKSVGLSHTTGEVTHHIAADVDAERDYVRTTFEGTGQLAKSDLVAGFHSILEGRNGGGDPWHTDGDLWVGVIGTEQ